MKPTAKGASPVSIESDVRNDLASKISASKMRQPARNKQKTGRLGGEKREGAAWPRAEA